MTDETGTDIAVVERKPLSTLIPGHPVRAYVPANMDDSVRLSRAIAASEMAPKSYKNDPNKILVGMMTGAELGLTPMQALRGIAVIGNMPSLWGDVALAVVQASGLLEDMVETQEGDFSGTALTGVATCTIKRKGRPTPVTRRYSMDRARKAKLLTKDGPWQSDPERMCQMRARAYTMRDMFADVLSGLGIAEVDEDDLTARAPSRAETVQATTDDLHAQAAGSIEAPRETAEPLATDAAVRATVEHEERATTAQSEAERLLTAEAQRVASQPKPSPARRPRVRNKPEEKPATESASGGHNDSPQSSGAEPKQEPEPAPSKRPPSAKDHMDRATYRELVEGYDREGRSDDPMRENAQRALVKLETDVDFDVDAVRITTGSDDAAEEAEFAEVEEDLTVPANFYTPEGYDLNQGHERPETSPYMLAVERLQQLDKVSEVAQFMPSEFLTFTPDEQMDFSSIKSKRVATLVAEAKRR